MNQWIRAIHIIAPNFFKVYKYHGDYRRHEPIANDKGFGGQLTKQHAIFQNSKTNVNVIVVTTPDTWLARHGLEGQRTYLKNSLNKSKREVDKANTELHPGWQYGLNDCFEVAAIDEAQ